MSMCRCKVSSNRVRLLSWIAALLIITGTANGLGIQKKELSSITCTFFELDNGKISLGSKKAKKRIMNAASKTTKDLAKLSQEHKRLAQQIEALDKPMYHAEEMELKHLKRRKLALKDAIIALRKNHRDYTDTRSKQNDFVVGSGGFADVWLGHQLVLTEHGDKQEKEPVAVKISRSPADNDTLLREAKFIKTLQDFPGFVRVQHVELDLKGNHTAVVLDLLGPSLEDLWWSCTCGAGGLSAPTVLRIADDMLQRLHDMLRVGIVHRDIQPANILMGRSGSSRQTPHLIDFGISIEMDSVAVPGKIPPRHRHAFSGTPRFASASALLAHGGGNRAADDLESLCYTLAFLRSGSLPWSDQAEEDAMMNNNGSNHGSRALATIKQQTNPSVICGTDLAFDPAAKAVAALLEHARLCTNKSPDYKKLRSIVRDALAQVGKEARESPPDWEQNCVTWSQDKGILQNTLYSL